MLINFCCFCFFILAGTLKAASQLNVKPVADSSSFNKPIRILSPNFYHQHTGFFCKKEDLLQKRTGVNVFFRLGSKNYVDKMEKK